MSHCPKQGQQYQRDGHGKQNHFQHMEMCIRDSNDMADSIGKSIQTLAGVTENGFSSSGFYVGFLLIIILIVGVYTAYTGLLKRETSKRCV